MNDDAYPFDSVSGVAPRDIAAAWERERPGVPTRSIEIVTALWRVGKLLADDRRRVLRAVGVDAATLDLLAVLRRSGPPHALTTREISARCLVSAGAISQRLTRAIDAGLVRREPSVAHRRAVLVTLTPRGHAVVERTVDGVLTREAELVRGLDDAERADLIRLLGRLTDSVRAGL